MITNPRFPFSPFPSGWYLLCDAKSISRGQALPFKRLGRDFVLFQTESGALHLLDAFCPHLGAHLGYGGKVQGERIQCPFHGWRLDGAGHCVEIPHTTNIPPKARLRAWPVRQSNGLATFFFHPQGEAPAEEIPELPEFRSEAWQCESSVTWTVKTHIQEILENIVDPGHFSSVHGMPGTPTIHLETQADRLKSVSQTKMQTPRGTVDATITWESFGPGLGWIRFSGIVETLFLIAVTPLDGESVEIRFVFFQKKADPEGVKRALREEICRQVDEDIPIWENKIYRPQPLLNSGEGTIPVFRRWFRQFLTETSQAEASAILSQEATP